MLTRFLHWFTNESGNEGGVVVASTHFMVRIEPDGNFDLLHADGSDVENLHLEELFDEYYFDQPNYPLAGDHPVEYDPETSTLSGLSSTLKPYRLVHAAGQEPRLLDHKTSEEETDDTVQSALAVALSQVDFSNLPNGEYHMPYDIDTNAFHGFSGGVPGGAGVTGVWQGPGVGPSAQEGTAEVPSDEPSSAEQVVAGEPTVSGEDTPVSQPQNDPGTDGAGIETPVPEAGEDPTCEVEPEAPRETASEAPTEVAPSKPAAEEPMTEEEPAEVSSGSNDGSGGGGSD